MINRLLRATALAMTLLPVVWFGCKEEVRNDHIDSNAPAPAQVTILDVRNTPGGAVLKYQTPKDENLLYVQAKYEIRPGVQRECKSSYYNDSLVLEGFGDTRTYDVQLYSVGKNKKTSESFTVQVNPTTPPVQMATVELREAFGGVGVRIQNPEKANLAIVLMGDTAQLGYQTYMETFYTQAEKADFALRGLDSIPGVYSVYLRDRWNNMSDTIAATLTPWFEEFIPKNTWQEVFLPNDIPLLDIYVLRNAWNGLFWGDGGLPNAFVSSSGQFPIWVTWDLGKTVKLSRLKYYHYGRYPWEFWNAKVFELYGSTDPNPDGSWESWTPLGHFETKKPSPGPVITQEDIDYCNNGIDLDFENSDFATDPFVPVRYIRFKSVESCIGLPVGNLYIQEISFWGQIVK